MHITQYLIPIVGNHGCHFQNQKFEQNGNGSKTCLAKHKIIVLYIPINKFMLHACKEKHKQHHNKCKKQPL